MSPCKSRCSLLVRINQLIRDPVPAVFVRYKISSAISHRAQSCCVRQQTLECRPDCVSLRTYHAADAGDLDFGKVAARREKYRRATCQRLQYSHGETLGVRGQSEEVRLSQQVQFVVPL